MPNARCKRQSFLEGGGQNRRTMCLKTLKFCGRQQIYGVLRLLRR